MSTHRHAKQTTQRIWCKRLHEFSGDADKPEDPGRDQQGAGLATILSHDNTCMQQADSCKRDNSLDLW